MIQTNNQPANPYARQMQYGKPVGTESPAEAVKRLEWDKNNVSANPIDVIMGKGAQIDTEIAGAKVKGRDQDIQQRLTDAGYLDYWYNQLGGGDYGRANVSSKSWGGWDNMGGHEAANKVFEDAFAHGESTGDWKAMADFYDQAQYGERKHHRSGLFGTGLSISPLGAFGLGLGGFVAAGGLGGAFGLPSGAASNLSSSGNAFSGVSGYNAASPFAAPLSQGSTLGALPQGVGSAVAGIGGARNSVGILEKLKNLKNFPVSSLTGGQGQAQGNSPVYSNYQAPFNPTTITGGDPSYSATNRSLSPVYNYSPTKYKTGLFNLESDYRGLQ